MYLALAVGLLMFTPLARGVIVLAPLGALVLAFRLIRRDRAAYIELLCWSYIACSFVRRVVDYRSGVNESVLLATPLLVLLAPLVFLLTRWRRVMTRDSAPFGYVLLALLYGTLLACLGFQVSGLVAELPIWLLPLALGLYLFVEREGVDQFYAGFERAMVAGTLFAGVYGLVQYFLMPAWDASWMVQTEMVTIGLPEPLEVRVFSTLNAPQVLAAFLMVGILVAYRSRLVYRWPAVGAGFMSLALSSARAAWIALVVGILYLVVRSSMRDRVRTLTFVGACTALIFVSMLIPAVNDTLSSRFESLSGGAQDNSAADRTETYDMLLNQLSVQPFGNGLGVDNGMGMSDAKHDSSIVNMLFSLGVFGSVMFVLGFGTISKRILLARPARYAPYLLTLQAVVIALLAETPLDNILSGPVAFLTWSSLGLGLARVAMPARSAEAAVLVRRTVVPRPLAMPPQTSGPASEFLP